MKIFIYVFFLFAGLGICKSQSIVSGKVVSREQQPLAASLKLKLSKNGTIAGTDGTFRISLQYPVDTLMVSFVGYSTINLPVTVKNTGPMNIVLDTKQIELNSVTVNTGYYTVPQERSTGSFTQLSEKALNTSVSTDILSRLEGIANGVYFDNRNPAERQISVRGLSTINGN